MADVAQHRVRTWDGRFGRVIDSECRERGYVYLIRLLDDTEGWIHGSLLTWNPDDWPAA